MTTPSFTNATANAVGTTETLIFTASNNAIVIGYSITNVTTATVPVSVKLWKSTGNVQLQSNVRVAANDSLHLPQGNKIVLKGGDSITVTSQVNSSVDVAFSIMQGVL
jgi:hypothetical protein